MAFYNNPFPATYQNPYYQQQQQMQPTQPQVVGTQMSSPTNNLIWVQGEAGMKAYLVAPNTTVPLWDSEAQVIYLKSADASGMPSVKTLDYTIRAENQPVQALQTQDHNFIGRDEFNALKGELDALKSELSNLKPRNTKKEDKNNG